MKSTVIPQVNESYYEKLQKSAVGKQSYWWKLLLEDDKGDDFLELCLKYEDSSTQITNDVYAMRIIIENYS